jgi:uncharacterized protein
MASESSGTDAPRDADSLTEEEKRTAMWCHLSALLGIFLPLPGVNVLAPLHFWRSGKETSRFVNFHGKESLNFQINMLLYSLLCCPFCCAGPVVPFFTGWNSVGKMATFGGLGLGILWIAIVTLFEIVVSVLASIKANEGEWYRYPYLLFRFFK